MQFTNQYKLNLIEATDTFSPQPLNENMEKVEAALKTQGEALSAAQAQHAQDIAALAASGLKVAFGSYTGNGKYGANNYTTITTAISPKFLIVWGPYAHVGLGCQNKPFSIHMDISGWECKTTWSDTSVSWYYASASNGQQQMNESGQTYHYVVFG